MFIYLFVNKYDYHLHKTPIRCLSLNKSLSLQRLELFFLNVVNLLFNFLKIYETIMDSFVDSIFVSVTFLFWIFEYHYETDRGYDLFVIIGSICQDSSVPVLFRTSLSLSDKD